MGIDVGIVRLERGIMLSVASATVSSLTDVVLWLFGWRLTTDLRLRRYGLRPSVHSARVGEIFADGAAALANGAELIVCQLAVCASSGASPFVAKTSEASSSMLAPSGRRFHVRGFQRPHIRRRLPSGHRWRPIQCC